MNISIKSFLLIVISSIVYSAYILSMNPTDINKNGPDIKNLQLTFWYPHIVPYAQDITNAKDFDQNRLRKKIAPIFKQECKVKKYIPRTPRKTIIMYDPTPTQIYPPLAPVRIYPQSRSRNTYQPEKPHTTTYPL